MAHLEPDVRFTGMYRIRFADGTLSDMMNLTWAKDTLAAVNRNGGMPYKPPQRKIKNH